MRDSYLALAIEFERLADVLELGAEAQQKSVYNGHDKQARSRLRE